MLEIRDREGCAVDRPGAQLRLSIRGDRSKGLVDGDRVYRDDLLIYVHQEGAVSRSHTSYGIPLRPKRPR